MMHFHVAPGEEGMTQSLCSYPGANKDEGRTPRSSARQGPVLVLEVVTDKINGNIQLFCGTGYSTISQGREPHRNRAISRISYGRRKAYALEFPGVFGEPFKRDSKCTPAFLARHLVDFIDHDKPDMFEMFTQPFSIKRAWSVSGVVMRR